jgi:hypothetical protein
MSRIYRAEAEHPPLANDATNFQVTSHMLLCDVALQVHLIIWDRFGSE